MKVIKIMVAVLLVFAIVLPLTACDTPISIDDLVGTWKGRLEYDSGIKDCVLVIKSDASYQMTCYNSNGSFFKEHSGYVTIEGEEIILQKDIGVLGGRFTYEDGNLTKGYRTFRKVEG